MGSSQSVASNQQILNDVKQDAENTCLIAAKQDISGNVVIDIGGTGDITLSNKISMSGNNCNLSASLDNQVENTLQALIDQKATTITGLLPDLSKTDQNIAIGQLIKNSIAQISHSACQIGFEQSIRNNYVLAQDSTANIKLVNDGTLDNSSCVLTNIIKDSLKNSETATAKQTSTMINGLVLILIAIVVVVIIVGGAFFLKPKSK